MKQLRLRSLAVLRGLPVLLAAALVPACTDFAPGEDVLTEDVLEQLPAAPPGEDWSCLEGADVRETPSLPAFAGDETRLVYSGRILDLSTGKVYADIRVRACGISDVDCATPVADNLAVNAEGWFDVPLFEGFNGFLEFRSPSILPMVFFFTEPLVQQTRNVYPFGAVSLESVPPLQRLAGLKQVPGSGLLVMRARDCVGTTAPGVSFTLQGEGSPFYFIGGLPTATATATDAAGFGGFGDVPAGLAVVSATTHDGTSIMASQNVLIRADWVSALYARPPQRLRGDAR
jgi:hypothetical protein